MSGNQALGRATAAVAALAMGLGLLVAGPARASTQGAAPPAVGLPIRAYDQSGTSVDTSLKMASAAGVKVVAAPIEWYDIELSPGQYNWAPLDQLLSSATARGMTVHVQAFGTPGWVHPEVTAADAGWYPPRGATELSDWTDFVTALVSRYGTRFTSYEIWNEPNTAQFWEPSPSPSEYATLLRSAYLAAKVVNPNVKIEFGGLSESDVGYLESYYAAAGTFPDSVANHSYFDRMVIHPYTADRLPDYGSPQDTVAGAWGPISLDFNGISAISNAMSSAGDRGKHVRIGEYGASTLATWMPAVSDQHRALMLERALTLSSAMPLVDEFDWYAFVANQVDSPAWTIVSSSYAASETYNVLSRYLASGTPAVSTTPSLAGQTVGGTLTVALRVSGSQSITSSELYVDGALAASAPGSKITWDTRLTPSGSHEVMAVAYVGSTAVDPAQPVTVTVANPAVRATGATLTIPATVTSGRSISAQAYVTASGEGILPAVVVAVRDAAGNAHDFPMLTNAPVAANGSAFAFSGVLPNPGIYSVFVSWYDGTSWIQLTAPQAVTAI